MSKNGQDIPTTSNGKRPPRDWDGDGIPDHRDEDLSVNEGTRWKYEPPKSFWKDKPLGRTLSLRNKTGKTIAGLAAGAVATFTGVDITPFIEPLTGGTQMFEIIADFGMIEMAITAITFLVVAGVSWIGAYFKLPKKFTGKITQFIEIASTEIEKATHEESEKGRKITKSEIRIALLETFKKVFKKYPNDLKSAKTE